MSKIEAAVQFMLNTANDNTHGYSRENRWGPDYDCSSLMVTAWQSAGVPVKTKGATYTGNMLKPFLACGFKNVTAQCNLSTAAGMQRGDVLLSPSHHTAMYLGDKKLVHARSTDGHPEAGDQSGKEIRVQNYYKPSYGWDYVLRYSEKEETEEAPETETVVVPVIETPVLTEVQTMPTPLPLLTRKQIEHEKREDVRALQALLSLRGFETKADGYFGPKTEAAIRSAQESGGLAVDGEAGRQVWAYLIQGG